MCVVMTPSLFMASLTTETLTLRTALVGSACLLALILIGSLGTRPTDRGNRAMIVGNLATPMTATSRSLHLSITSLRSLIGLAVLSVVGGLALGLLVCSAMIVVVNGA